MKQVRHDDDDKNKPWLETRQQGLLAVSPILQNAFRMFVLPGYGRLHGRTGTLLALIQGVTLVWKEDGMGSEITMTVVGERQEAFERKILLSLYMHERASMIFSLIFTITTVSSSVLSLWCFRRLEGLKPRPILRREAVRSTCLPNHRDKGNQGPSKKNLLLTKILRLARLCASSPSCLEGSAFAWLARPSFTA